MTTIQLPKALQAKFELVNWPGNSLRQFFGRKFQIVDLEKITEAQVERLVKMEFPYLKKKDAETKDVSNSTKNKS